MFETVCVLYEVKSEAKDKSWRYYNPSWSTYISESLQGKYKKNNSLSDIPIALNYTGVTEEERRKFTACILCSVERHISATNMLGDFLHSSLQFKV